MLKKYKKTIDHRRDSSLYPEQHRVVVIGRSFWAIGRWKIILFLSVSLLVGGTITLSAIRIRRDSNRSTDVHVNDFTSDSDSVNDSVTQNVENEGGDDKTGNGQDSTGSNESNDTGSGGNQYVTTPSLPEHPEVVNCETNPLQHSCLPDNCPTSLAQITENPFRVCGSVNQVYIVNAESNVHVSVTGPQNYNGVTDSNGGLVMRNIVAGKYIVTVGDSTGAVPTKDNSYAIEVMTPTDHPSQDFYAAQDLSSAEGYIKMRDNTFLDYHLEKPAGGCTEASPCDVLVTYSGYTPGLPPVDWETTPFDNFIPQGYAVMGVNMRGTGCSGGSFNLMEELVGIDGYDIVEAIAAQPWVDDVALADKSWPGLSQLYVASTQPPSLKAIIPGAPVGDFYRDIMYPGGLPNTGFGTIWMTGRDESNAWPSSNLRVVFSAALDPVCLYNQKLRGQNVVLMDKFNESLFNEAFWQARVVKADRITVPTMLVVSWQDEQTGSRVAGLFNEIPASTPKRLIGSNGGHGLYWLGDVWGEVLEFANVYLRGDTATIAAYEAQDPIKVFVETDVNGNSRASYTLSSFKSTGTGERLTIGSELTPDGPDTPANQQSSYAYSPTLSSINWSTVVQDQVTFTSTELTQAKLVAGSASVDLWVSANVTDADLRATISELRPDGKEMYIQSGWIRISNRMLDGALSTELRPWHHFTAAAAQAMTPNSPTQVRVELFPFSHVFRAGSKIRLTVDAPPGPGLSLGWTFGTLPGGFNITVLHNGVYPSSIVLPTLITPSAQTVIQGVPTLPECNIVWNQPCR